MTRLDIAGEDRVRLLLRELADVLPVGDVDIPMYREVRVTSGFAELRRRPQRLVLVAASLLAVIAGVVVISVMRPTRAEPHDVEGIELDVGNVSSFPPGSVTPVAGQRLFIVNDPATGLIALSSGFEPGCELERIADYRGNIGSVRKSPSILEPPGSEFINPCTTLTYSIDGAVQRGAASTRGMFRYRLTVRNGAVLVDLSLATPGARLDRIPDPAPLWDLRGVTDHSALAWRYATSSVAPSSIVVLGAFHRNDGVVSIPVTFDESLGDLQVVPANAGPLPTAGRLVVLDRSTPSGRLVVWGRSVGDSLLTAELLLSDGRRIRLELVGAPQTAMPGAESVALFLERLASRAAAFGA